MTDLHPIKVEHFYLNKNINVDPKGFDRTVDTYKVTDFGLYMARGADHPYFGYLESWLLPALGLRVNRIHYRKEIAPEQYDLYIDVAEIIPGVDEWTTRDLYIDFLWNKGKPIQVVDVDELVAATAAGLINPEDSEYAINATLQALRGISSHNDDPLNWLAHAGYPLEWAQEITLTAPAK